MDTISDSLFNLWMFVTISLFTVFIGLTCFSVWIFIKKQRWGFSGFIILFLCLTGVTVLVNPLGNMVLFASITEKMTEEMWDSFHSEKIIGKHSKFLIEKYGKPRRIAGDETYETWYYYPGPWYAVKWTRLLINVKNNIVIEYFRDD